MRKRNWKEFENIVLEPTKQDLTTFGGEKIQTIGLPKGLDPDTFIEDITNSNFTLFFGNHAFPNFRPISLNYGDARFGSQDFISTNPETGEKISLDEFSESINGMSDEQYKKASIEKALTHVFTTPVLLLRDFLRKFS